MAREFEAFPELAVHTLPNAVSREVEERAQTTTAQYPKQSDALRILYLSNLIPSKGLVELIDAADGQGCGS